MAARFREVSPAGYRGGAVSVEVVLRLNGAPVPVVLDDDALAAIAAAVTPTREPEPESPYVTVPEAAKWLRTSRQAVDDLLSANKLARHKVGRRTLIARADLRALVECRRRGR